MSCTIINSNANIATGNGMKEYRRWTYVPYSGKLSRERTFMNSTVLWLFVKVFSAKFGNKMFFGAAKLSNPQKFSLQKFIFTSLWKFSPSKVSRYTVYVELKATVCYIWISAHVSETTTNTTASASHTKHTSRHSISNDCRIIQSNLVCTTHTETEQYVLLYVHCNCLQLRFTQLSGEKGRRKKQQQLVMMPIIPATCLMERMLPLCSV